MGTATTAVTNLSGQTIVVPYIGTVVAPGVTIPAIANRTNSVKGKAYAFDLIFEYEKFKLSSEYIKVENDFENLTATLNQTKNPLFISLLSDYGYGLDRKDEVMKGYYIQGEYSFNKIKTYIVYEETNLEKSAGYGLDGYKSIGFGINYRISQNVFFKNEIDVVTIEKANGNFATFVKANGYNNEAGKIKQFASSLTIAF